MLGEGRGGSSLLCKILDLLVAWKPRIIVINLPFQSKVVFGFAGGACMCHQSVVQKPPRAEGFTENLLALARAKSLEPAACGVSRRQTWKSVIRTWLCPVIHSFC